MNPAVHLTFVNVILSTHYSLATPYYDHYGKGKGKDDGLYQHPDYFKQTIPYHKHNAYLFNENKPYSANIIKNYLNRLRRYNNVKALNSHHPNIKKYKDITPNMDFVKNEKLQLKIFYEVLCPYCRKFETEQLVSVVKKLGNNLDIYTYPYGNAETTAHNGRWVFSCQHGAAECFGNKLHACVIDTLQNNTEAILFNACLMEDTQQGEGSDTLALNACGARFDVGVDPIKRCAIGRRGSQLLKYYGDETEKAGVNGVPYILINGVNSDGVNVWRDVCNAFKTPPEVCRPHRE